MAQVFDFGKALGDTVFGTGAPAPSGLPCVLGIDVGLAHVGYALVALEGNSERVLDMRTIVTKKSDAKLGVLVAHDDIRRVREILDALHVVISSAGQPGLSGVHAICAELPHGSKGARAAAALGIGKAIVAALGWRYQLPIAACNPQQLKKTLAGSQSASKAEVQVALCRRYGKSVAEVLVRETGSYKGAKRQHWTWHARPDIRDEAMMYTWGYEECEHVGDALGAVVTCLDSDVVRMVRRMAQ